MSSAWENVWSPTNRLACSGIDLRDPVVFTTSGFPNMNSFVRFAAAIGMTLLVMVRVSAADWDNSAGKAAADPALSRAPWTIPVLVIHYFPLTEDKKKIDIRVTSNVGAPIQEIEAKCQKMTKEVIQALEGGSRFRVYNNPKAAASLKYTVTGSLTYYEPVPHHPKKKNYTDYNKIMERVKIQDWVEKKGVREVWIWGYHSK